MRLKATKGRHPESGFTLMEVLMATIILLISLVGVAKLVPMSVALNSENRRDSTSLVIAQREMDAMIAQPISATTFTDPQGLTCPVGSTCDLGNAAAPKTVVGSPVIMSANRPMIDYTQPTVAGYSFNYADPNDPASTTYDIRWAVITYVNGTTTTGRRLIVGVCRLGGNAPLLPVTLDSLVEK